MQVQRGKIRVVNSCPAPYSALSQSYSAKRCYQACIIFEYAYEYDDMLNIDLDINNKRIEV
jgi:hypothetical protein